LVAEVIFEVDLKELEAKKKCMKHIFTGSTDTKEEDTEGKEKPEAFAMKMMRSYRRSQANTSRWEGPVEATRNAQ
jgi:hypothetical protein